jgi:hypothetical protein
MEIVPILINILKVPKVVSESVDMVQVQSMVSEALSLHLQKPSTSVTRQQKSESHSGKYFLAIAENIEEGNHMEGINTSSIEGESKSLDSYTLSAEDTPEALESNIDTREDDSRKRSRSLKSRKAITSKSCRSSGTKDVSKNKKIVTSPNGAKFEEALVRYEANCVKFREVVEEERRKLSSNQSQDTNDDISANNLLPKWVNALIANSIADFGCPKCDARFYYDPNNRKESLRCHLLDTCHFLDDIRSIANSQGKIRSKTVSRRKLDSPKIVSSTVQHSMNNSHSRSSSAIDSVLESAEGLQ